MALVAVPTARATIGESPEGLLITIPARKNWFLILFMGFWLMGWLFGEVTAIHGIMFGQVQHHANLGGGAPGHANAFLTIWLAGWTLGGGFFLITWLWNLAGVERILLGPDRFATRREILGIGPLKEYQIGSMTNLRINPVAATLNERMSPFQMVSGGTIAFDYGAKTYRFGIGLEEAEAQQIIDRMKSRHTF